METITSLQNPRVKDLLKLRSRRGRREGERRMIVEGLDEIRMAVAAGYRPQALVTAHGITRGASPGLDVELIPVSVPIFEKLAYRENPDGWLAIFAVPPSGLADLNLLGTPLVIAMESVEKPGNLGAILRTADAAGVDAVLVCDRRGSVYSPNVVRASRGALFAVPVAMASSAEAIAFLRAQGIRILAASPGAGVDYTGQDLLGPLAIAVGSEDEGLSHAWLDQADVQVKIPMVGKVNSLNVSVATALIVYEVLRQRGAVNRALAPTVKEK
jgi:TrmH family RNA methyltransferase